jgi:selenophosphate synthase
MSTLNLCGASLFKKYKIRASTDVTGFGILGHANYLALA